MARSSIARMVGAVEDGPLGDEIHDLHEAVEKLSVSEGPLHAYFENRKMQVCYFISDNTNRAGMEQAVADLKVELAQYRKELASDPAHPRYEAAPNILDFGDRSGITVKLGVASLPPPLNRGDIPPGYLETLNSFDMEEEGRVADKLWMHYKELNPHWMTDVAGLIRPPSQPESHVKNLALPNLTLPLTPKPQPKTLLDER